jgi:DNA-binding beta-propeller fold protein YncE
MKRSQRYVAAPLLAAAALTVAAVPARGDHLTFITSFDLGQFGARPGQVAVSEGLVYVNDFNNDQILRFDPRNFPASLTSFGTFGSGIGQFDTPTGVGVSRGLVYVADNGNNRIVRFDPSNFAASFTTFGSFGFGRGQFFTPGGLAASDGLVYVADTGANRIVRFDPNDFDASFTSFQTAFPWGVAVSGGLVYAAEFSLPPLFSRIVRFDPNDFDGSFTTFGSMGSGSGQFLAPTGVAVSGGLVYVADRSNNRIVEFDPNDFDASFASFGSLGSGIGQFDSPEGVAVDGSGNLFVADLNNSRVVQLAVVPAPSSLALLAAGGLAVLAYRGTWRRSRWAV